MKKILCFGSNEAGIHGAGAAKDAYQKHGARWGKGYGHYGDSFAVPTKDRQIKTLPLERIKMYVDGLKAYAVGNPELIFQITRLGCGLAGYQDKDIVSLFLGSSLNCEFDESWRYFLGDKYAYWGHQ